jgi:tubulin monoglycylase TTLL3/8
VTKVGLCNSLKNLVWHSSLPKDEFFPRCYNLTDMAELEEFKEDFRATKAESILKRYVKKKETSQVEKLLIAIHINEKRLCDVDDCIDDPDLENLVTEDEWSAIEKEKWLDEAQHQNLLAQTWYRKIQVMY